MAKKLDWSRLQRRRSPNCQPIIGSGEPRLAPLRQDISDPRGPRPSARALACQRAYRLRLEMEAAV